METLLLIIGIIAAVLFFFRPTPQPQIMYVPVEVANPRGGGIGCLPLIFAVVLVLLLMGAIHL